MVNVFVLLFLISFIALVIGLIKPSLFSRITGGSRKKTGVILGGLTFLFFILIGATAPPVEPQVASSSTEKGSETQTSASPALLSTPTPSPFPSHGGIFVKVVNVVDGDTIKIETGETVRYIGIDTPETVHPNKPVQCYGKEASDKNTALVEGKVVELEKDISEKDKYGRLLRYIWIGDMLVNETLVREGYAQSNTYPPDVKYQDRFLAAQKLAREEQKGLWGEVCASATLQPTSKPTQAATTTNTGASPTSAQSSGGSGTYACNCSKTCGQMSSCAEAQYQLNVCGCAARDADHDGIACDSDCQ